MSGEYRTISAPLLNVLRDPRPYFRPRLGEDAAMLAAIRQATQVAIATGEFPGRLGLPEGHEAVLWIGKPHAPAAFATIVDAGHGRAWLDLLYVRPEFRRGGLGRRLIDAAVEAARRADYREIVFGTGLDNAAMRAMGAAAGFTERYVDLVMPLGNSAAGGGAAGHAP
jgi:GNAT superfamily N-acetyltransferase